MASDGYLLGHRVLRAPCARYRQALPALILLAALALAAALAPYLAPHDPLALDPAGAAAGPTWAHPLGTDHLGRDVLSRLFYGARASLGTAGAVVLLATVVGLAVGLVAGFCGGWVDEVLMRLVDVVLAFPSFILALVVAGLLGPGLGNVVLAMVLVRWAGCARVVRGLVLSLREREFVLAARCTGAGNVRIMTRHLLPNVLGPVVVLGSLDLGNVVLGLSGLSFVGLGVQLPYPEWGAMLNHARPYMQTAPMLMVCPGLAIALTVLSANLLGDAVRDLLDPQSP